VQRLITTTRRKPLDLEVETRHNERMNNVVDFTAYRKSKSIPTETDIRCGCGLLMWDTTVSTGGSLRYSGGIPTRPLPQAGGVLTEIIRAERVLVCKGCTAMVALGLE